ncbi:DUF5305 domain-containing protein [Halorubrum sp. Ea8]|uniref:DUF5305 domain-containing protein n=1 Tax=Halorubrum sp. Ea8 TaxID=1383841 RepID=UPI000B99A2CA|nr:DUF5305 domain-containing protein [Halorubrum sp. Ea8]OYR44313.1 hypothetical protein DJ74_17945 [Halorubrum sp. Ea8]
MSSSSPDENRLRLRAVLDAQFAVIVAVLLIAAAVGGALVYTTHVDPGTETRERTVSSFTVETAYNHTAEVTEPNSVFQIGTVLDDRTTYFTRIAPELDVAVETTYAAASASDVDVRFDSVLVIRNVGEDGNVVYWSEREPLASETVSDVDPGGTATASFALNSSAVDATAAEIEEELGASPGETETFVVTDVAVEGTINGEPTSYARTVRLGIDHGGDTYTVSDPGVRSDTSDRTETVTVDQSYGPLRSIGGPLLFVVGLAGAGALVYARREREFALTPAERDYLSYRDDRSEFAEWITTFRLPASVHERPEAEAESLRDLVDFAIDNDTGVVEDPETGAYHAVAGDFVYTYRPPSPPSVDALSEGEDGDAPAVDDLTAADGAVGAEDVDARDGDGADVDVDDDGADSDGAEATGTDAAGDDDPGSDDAGRE